MMQQYQNASPVVQLTGQPKFIRLERCIMRACQHTAARQKRPVGVTKVFATMRSELKIHSRAILQPLCAEKGVIWLCWALFCI
jgi:hypothetical protein